MNEVQPSRWAWIVLLTVAALIVPALVGFVLFDQARVPMLGIYVTDADPPVIAQVMTGSAAAAAGLRAGDAVIAVDGQPYAAWYLGSRRLGQAYGFDLQRAGRPQNVRVTMGSLLQANRPGTLSAVLVALVFWGTGMLLVRWGWRQVHIDLLVLLFQACGAAVLPGLAYPRFLLPRPWLVAAGVSGVIMAAPLLLHYHLSFPVVLGRGRRRSLGLAVLYLLAAAGVADAALRAVPWRSPALAGASLVGMLAIGVAVFVYFRRASADGRRRLRVVVAGTALGILPPLVAYLLPTVVAGYTPAIPRWLVSLCVAIVPLSYLYASVRHNLFGIDRLLNRTLVYGILASAVFMLGLGLLLLADRLAPSNRLLHAAVVAVLALLVAMAFTWARTQVQRLVDRLFYGGWYDYPAVVERASTALAGCQQWEQVARILTDEAPAQMQLSGAQLCVGERSTPPLAQGPAPRLELPLRCGQQARGAWTVGPRRDGEPFTSADRRILQTLARQAETALSNVLLLELLRGQLDEIRASRATLVQLQHALLRSREEERGRLARDLHDGPIQALVGLNLQLGLLTSSTGLGGTDAPVVQAVREMRAEVRTLLGELREVCTELRPPMLDTLGIGAALRALAADWSAQHGVAAQLDLPADAALRSLPAEVAVNFYRVAQEALANVAHHAVAHQVNLRLAWDATAGCLELVVQDDGCGFAPAAVEDLAGRGHFGLAGIRERMNLIGGEWRLESAPGKGTTVQVVWRAQGVTQ